MKKHIVKRVAALSAITLAAISLAACGSSSGSEAKLADGGWDAVVKAAKKEGSVTIYSGQGAAQLEDMAAGFKKKYGITVEVVRAIDAELIPKFEAETRANKPAVDVLVLSGEAAQDDYGKAGRFADAVGPTFDEVEGVKHDNNFFDVDATVITFAWNTKSFSGTPANYEDLLDPALKGKIGVPEPTVPAFVDFYLYLERLYGEDFSEKLAAQDPKIYPGALPAAQALSSGEIAAAVYVEPQIDEKAAGAPVEWGFEKEQWAAMFYGAVVKDSPHPNAGQLLADYLMTTEGQSKIARKAASIRADVPGTVGTTETIHRLDTTKITPEVVEDYQAKWNSLFR